MNDYSSYQVSTPCACMGPRNGEPVCECKMRSGKIPRSAEHIKEAAEARIRLDAFFTKMKERGKS